MKTAEEIRATYEELFPICTEAGRREIDYETWLVKEVIDLLDHIQQQNQWVRVEDRLPEPMACPACGAEEPMIGRLDSEYMACDACNTKWRKPDYPNPPKPEQR